MTTLLAVDDSNTMRKVLEITFAGEPFETLLAGDAEDAMMKLDERRPDIALIDVTLGDPDGYDLCKRVKTEFSGIRVVLMSSKQNPYDPNRGASAGADDHIDKPFETQALIDKVKALADAPAPSAVVSPSRAAPAAIHSVETKVPGQNETISAPDSGVQSGVPLVISEPPLANEINEADLESIPAPTIEPAAPSVAPAAPSAVPAPRAPSVQPTRAAIPSAPARPPYSAPAPQAVRAPTSAVPAPTSAVPAPAAASAAPAATNGAAAAASLESKLVSLGLNAAQVQGVLALSKEVIEQAVWEVVPTLAETLIKEEIARLTRE